MSKEALFISKENFFQMLYASDEIPHEQKIELSRMAVWTGSPFPTPPGPDYRMPPDYLQTQCFPHNPPPIGNQAPIYPMERDSYTTLLIKARPHLPKMNMKAFLGPRDSLETDPTKLQIIPYLSFTFNKGGIGDCIVKYTRGSKGGEDRLKTKHSIGFGGHIEEAPVDVGAHFLFDVIFKAALREVEEELDLPMCPALEAYIKDTLVRNSYFILEDSPVGSVHLGLTANIELADTSLIKNNHVLEKYLINLPFEGEGDGSKDVEKDIVKDLTVVPLHSSLIMDYNWESWSQAALGGIDTDYYFC